MCQYSTKDQNIHTLDKDLKCWKVVDSRTSAMERADGKRFTAETGCISLFERFVYFYDKLYHSEIGINDMGTPPESKRQKRIFEGFHAFTNYDQTLEFLNEAWKTGDTGAIVVECTIPSGSEIIFGVWGDDYVTEQAVANQIILHRPPCVSSTKN